MASDTDGAAPAAADSSPTPAEPEVVQPPAPVSTDPSTDPPASTEDKKPDPKEKAEPKPVSTREALRKAAEKVDADEKTKTEAKPLKTDADKKPEAKPDAKTEGKPDAERTEPRPRSEDGKFAPKEGSAPKAEPPKATNFAEPPSRFSQDAKAAWKDAPEPVRAEVYRATRELEQGIQKYKGDAEAFAELKPFHELATKQGTTLKAAMSNYVGIEQKLRTDFIGGLEAICNNRGVSLRQVAAQVMGQKPEEAAGRQDATIGQLRQQIAQLQQQVGGVTKTLEQQRSDATMSTVTAFASKPGHERFEELATDIKLFLESGRAPDLDEAYRLAERLNPGPATQPNPNPAPASAPVTDQTAQNRNGQKSITGAPGHGSSPASVPSPSTRKALERAFAQAG